MNKGRLQRPHVTLIGKVSCIASEALCIVPSLGFLVQTSQTLQHRMKPNHLFNQRFILARPVRFMNPLYFRHRRDLMYVRLLRIVWLPRKH